MGADNNQERSKTISEFCDAKRISLSSFYELEKRGLGPETQDILGKIRRITPEAERAWDQQMAELKRTEAAKLEAERRRAQATAAGKVAAQSPMHVSRRPRQSRRRG
jgi:hypothetical protein